MSEIFTPALGVIKPQYIDGFENIVTRAQGVSTNSTSFATIAQIEILPNVFNDSRNNVRLKPEYFGRVTGAAGNKQLRLVFDATVIGTTTGHNLGADGNWRLEGILVYRSSQIIMPQLWYATGPTGTGATIQSLVGLQVPIACDPTISHTILLQALVVNAADTIFCDSFGALLR